MFIVLAILLAGAMIYGITSTQTVTAAVSGPCADCHTMHNSQNGTPMTFDGTQPHPNLTRGSCWGCHTSDTYDSLGVDLDSPTTTAGGTFNATIANSDAKKHNVVEISDPEGTLTVVPGVATGSRGSNITNINQQFSCAGATGCHGRTDTGITGSHHAQNAGYRFLRIGNGAGTLVLGKGSPNRERGGATATNHNVYSADTTAGISRFCAECHGVFHTDTISNGAFIRHPTDNLIPSTWNVTVDYNNNPFAFTGTEYNNASTNTAYTTNGARVACVSCHRAHGSAYDDILRFDYATQVAGGGNTVGCLGCHSAQR